MKKIYLWSQELYKFRSFASPVQVWQVRDLAKINESLQEIEQECQTNHLYAVLFLSYEAAPAFDTALQVAAQRQSYPLLYAATFRDFTLEKMSEEITEESISQKPPEFSASLTYDEYLKNFIEIQKEIKHGDTYQVNYTFPLYSDYEKDTFALFKNWYFAQPVPYACFADFEEFQISSLSPELFFRKTKQEIFCAPMKGTALRGFTNEEDEIIKKELASSEKARAENVMIVDLIRNDLAKIASEDSVKVNQLFKLEKYRSVFQLVSEVTAQTCANLAEIFTALFPCASVTGAPKVSTSKIIAKLEGQGRGIYTGSIGVIEPTGDAQFSVAIRTACYSQEAKKIVYSVGSGITAGSNPEEEYLECLAKAKILSEVTNNFSLLETMLWDAKTQQIFLLDRHLKRLEDSARYFDFKFFRQTILQELEQFKFQTNQKLRLLLSAQGKIIIEAHEFSASPKIPKITLAKSFTETDNIFVCHKTTNRRVYEEALLEYSGFDDVILWNKRNEILETCIGNIVLEIKGEFLTPKLQRGILPGTYRAELLEQGKISEAVLRVDDLGKASSVIRINSLRGWERCDV